MSKRWRWLVVAAILLFFILSLAQAPARLFSLAASRWFVQIIITGTEGTLWNGQAGQVLVSVGDGAMALGRLRWQVDGLSLLRLRLGLHIETDHPQQALVGNLELSPFGAIDVNDAQGHFPLSVLEPWVPLLIVGDAFFKLEELQADSRGHVSSVTGNFDLRDIRWQGGDYPMLLGHYHAALHQQNGAVVMDFNDVDESLLTARGQLNVGMDGAYQLAAQLRATERLAPQVAQAITWLGKKNNDGKIEILQQGRWR